VTDNVICLYAWFIDLRLKLFIDLLPSHVNDLLKLSEHYHIGRLFWPILSTIGLSDFHTIVLTLVTATRKREMLTNTTRHWLSASNWTVTALHAFLNFWWTTSSVHLKYSMQQVPADWTAMHAYIHTKSYEEHRCRNDFSVREQKLNDSGQLSLPSLQGRQISSNLYLIIHAYRYKNSESMPENTVGWRPQCGWLGHRSV